MSKKRVLPTFSIGDQVEWTSQAAGTVRTKRGEVVAVVSRGVRYQDALRSLREERGEQFSQHFDGGLPREHESYFVAVSNPSGRGKRKLYWPRTSALRATP